MDSVSYENRYGDDKVYDACGLFGVMDITGQRSSGHDVVRAIGNMEERGNGLGAGFAAYGCYPDHADCYAFHVMYIEPDSRSQVEAFLRSSFVLVHAEEMPHRATPGLINPPLIWRYFLRIDGSAENFVLQDEAEYVVRKVMEVNAGGQGAYIYGSGKNVGVFKGVGHPAQIAEYFGVEDYEAYIWTAHARFPANTPGWWGGRTHSACWIGRSFTMERSPPTVQIAVILRCRAITARCTPTQR